MSKMSDSRRRCNCLVYLDATIQLPFEVLLSKLLNELNVPRVRMFYTDEEGDEVAVGSQEELDEAMKSARAPNELLCIRVCTEEAEGSSGQHGSGSGGHYSQLAQWIREERKGSAEGGKPHPPKWFTPAMSENNVYLLDEINKAFNEAVGVLSSIRTVPGAGFRAPPASTAARSQTAHCNIICDSCEKPIFGVRYKCGNCANYDLCEACEALSQDIHCPTHVFLKLKVPVAYCMSSKALLRKDLYVLEPVNDQYSSGLDDDMPAGSDGYSSHLSSMEAKDEMKRRKLENKIVAMGVGSGGAPPTCTEGCVERTREELKEEIRRKKLEKKMRACVSPHGLSKEEALKQDLKMLKMEKKREKKMAKLQAHGVVLSGMVADEGSMQGSRSYKRPNKYLAATVVADRNYPPGSVVPCGQPFEKSWVVANTGTKKWKHMKLAHQVGYTPVSTEIDVPDLKPDEQTILTVEYPPIGKGQQEQITSSWRLIHKGSTPIGPTLWLSVLCDKEALGLAGTFQATPLFSVKSDTVASVPAACVVDNPKTVPSMGSLPPAGTTEEPKLCDGNVADITSSMSSDKLVQTFEMVRQLSHKSSAPPSEIDLGDKQCENKEDQLGASDDEFVVVIPDCFNLDVPLPELTSVHSAHYEEVTDRRSSTPSLLNDPSTSICSECGGVKSGDQEDDTGVENRCGDDSVKAGDGESGSKCGDGDGDNVCAGDDDHECGNDDNGDGECGGSDGECGDGGDHECGGDDDRHVSDGGSGSANDGREGVEVPCQPNEDLGRSGGVNPPPPKAAAHATARGCSTFTLQEMSLGRIFDARIKNPITIAAAVVNTASKLVEKGVNFSSPKVAKVTHASPSSEDEDKFEDAPEPHETCPQTTAQSVACTTTVTTATSTFANTFTTTTTSTATNRTSTSTTPHIAPYLDRDVTRFIPHQSAGWEAPKWTGPTQPSTPMEQLISMGFANREINTRLLEKHNNNVEAVLNELLEERESESRHV